MIRLLRKAIRTTGLMLLSAFIVSTVLCLGFHTALAEAQRPLVKVIVDSTVYNSIQSSLDRYRMDVESSGFLVNLTETNLLSDTTPEGVRACLQRDQSHGLVGALLVGDVCEAWFEVKDHKFPTDMYYMDLDGIWFDLNNNGVYDARGGNLAPEIWIGRLKVSTVEGDQVSLLNSYFSKNHAYRNGLFDIPWWRSLLYIDDPGTFNVKEAETSLGYVTTYKTVVADQSTTTTTDYKNRLADPVGFQWLYLMSHGEAGRHDFYAPIEGIPRFEGSIYSEDYSKINPRILFYQFFTCDATRYTDQDYLAGSAVLATQWGLAAIGSSDDMFTVSVDEFYRSISGGESLGASFKQWLSSVVKEYATGFLSEERYQILCNAVNLIGDPTLIPIIETHDVSVTNLEVSISNSTGAESLSITVTVENHGESVEQVRVEILYDYRSVFVLEADLGVGERTTVTFSPLNSYQFIWGTHGTHSVEAKASVSSGEFHDSDNAQTAFFDGKIIENPRLPQLSPLIYVLVANVIFGLMGWGTIRMIMSDRPAVFIYLTRLFRSLVKKHGS